MKFLEVYYAVYPKEFLAVTHFIILCHNIFFLCREIVKTELSAANQQQAFGIAVLLLVLVISPVIIFLVRNATVTIQVFSVSLSRKVYELKMEKRKADALTYQMLPASVAKVASQ